MRSGAGDKCLTILHFNDFHGAFEPDEKATGPSGGAARLVTVLKQAEKESAARGCDTFILFGGDAYSGSLISSEYRGEAERRFLNSAGVDAMVVGNHDFDYGMKGVRALVKESLFPVVSANIYLNDHGPTLLTPLALLGPQGAPALLLFGLTSEETPLLTAAANVEGLVFTDAIEEAKRQDTDIEGKTSVKIALTHLGVAGDEKLAKEVRLFDAVIGGHDHVRPEDYCRKVDETPVCQTPAQGKYVGELRFSVGVDGVRLVGSKLIPVTAEVREDAAVAAMVLGYAKAVGQKFDRVIGEASGDIMRRREDRPHAMGVLVADAFREVGKADIGLAINGGVRANLKKGLIRLRDAAAVLPFESQVVVLSLTGAHLLEIIAHGIARGGAAFPQMAGVTFDIVDGAPNNVQVKGKPVDTQEMYTLATDAFLADGGEGYAMFLKLPMRETGVLARDALVALIVGRKVVTPPSLP